MSRLLKFPRHDDAVEIRLPSGVGLALGEAPDGGCLRSAVLHIAVSPLSYSPAQENGSAGATIPIKPANKAST